MSEGKFKKTLRDKRANPKKNRRCPNCSSKLQYTEGYVTCSKCDWSP